MKNIAEEVKGHMQHIAKMIEGEIPEGWGFILMTYPHNTTGELIYVSNSNREDVIKCMDEFKEKTVATYGNDTGKYGV